MVRKLFKYEFAAYARVLIPVYIAMSGIAVLSRILQIFASDTTSSAILIGSSIFMYVIAVLAAFGFVNIFAVVRFHKNMFSGEGYLTLTLPATATQHIFSKLLAALLYSLFSFIAFCISFSIITAGDIFKEVFDALIYLLKQAKWYYVLEAVLNAIVGVASNVLLFYTCVSIGQLFKKNRTFGAVITYFAYNFAIQILSTLALGAVAGSEYLSDIIEFILQRNYIISGIMSVVFFFVTRHIITNKLNLE